MINTIATNDIYTHVNISITSLRDEVANPMTYNTSIIIAKYIGILEVNNLLILLSDSVIIRGY